MPVWTPPAIRDESPRGTTGNIVEIRVKRPHMPVATLHRRVLAGLLALGSLAVSAAEVPLTALSDPVASYFVLERQSYTSSVRLLLRRVTPMDVSYSWPDFDCAKRTVSDFVSFDNIEDVRRASPYAKATPALPGSVAGDLWIEVCEVGRTAEEKLAMARWEALNERSRTRQRIWETRPHRREQPLRRQNVSDSEISEIESAAADLFPGAIVNIGSVVSGCPCEDGPKCSSQVWIVAYLPEKSTGVLLSRIGRRWTVGPVQRWWLDYEALQARSPGMWTDAVEALNDRFPTCASTPPASGEQALILPPG